MIKMNFQTEFDFTLPRGYVDESGNIHREGKMRLAVALDEIEAIHDPRVLANEAYLPVTLLSRVITRLGSLPAVTPQVIEQIYASDFAYLEDIYLRLNSQENLLVSAICPHCNNTFQLQVAPLEGGEE
jgi:hypothetical protein